MDFITPTIKPSIDAVKSILGAARRKWGKRKYEKLLATTIGELLKEHPDLTAAEANLAAACSELRRRRRDLSAQITGTLQLFGVRLPSTSAIVVAP